MSGKFWLVAAGLTLAATACGAPASSTAPGAASSGPKMGGTLNYRAQYDPFDWDLSYGGKSNVPLSGRAWQALITWKAGPGTDWNQFTLQPNLAESWEVSPDAKTFTYHLRKGVKWANQAPVNGRELTAADVKFSYEYWARAGQFKDQKLPEGEFSWIFEGMQAIDTPDPYTVAIRFKDAYVPFLNYSANEHIPVVPHEIYDQDGHFKDRVVGSGPFMLDESASQKGTRWVWKRNPTYWDPGKPYLNEVRDIVLPDDSAAYAAFQTGQIDMLNESLPVRDGQEILQKDPSAVGLLYLEATAREMLMNPLKAPLNDVRVRKAINFGIDRDEFVKVSTDGKGGWALAGALASDFTQDEIKKMIPYDPAEAKRLLAEAGYPNGLDLQFEYPTDRGNDEAVEATLMQSQLKKIGINLTLKPMPYAEFSTMKKKKEHSMNLILRSYGGDADYSLYRIFHPDSKNNYDAIDDPKLRSLLDGQRQETNPEKREQLIRDAIRYINTDIAIGRALYFPAYYMIWKPYVKNFAPQKGHRSHYLTETWLDR